jgi:hypothetical protein
MSIDEIIWTILLGALVIELTEAAAWLAVRVARRAAVLRYPQRPDRAAIRAREWASVVEERPGKLFKLATAIGFVCVALTSRSNAALRHRHLRWLRLSTPTEGKLFGASAPLISVLMFRDEPLSTSIYTTVLVAVFIVPTIVRRTLNRRRTLRKLIPMLISDDVVTTEDADLVTSWLVQRRNLTPPIRSATAALASALLAAVEQHDFRAAYCASDGDSQELPIRLIRGRHARALARKRRAASQEK